ncbi:LOW QUALITY PROTEIN: armadillo repeat-containing protein 10-like [Dugong dugon]
MHLRTSVNVENQDTRKIYISQVCEDVFSGSLNAAVQMAGLRLSTNMTISNDHQHMFNSYVTDFFHVLLTGNGNIKVQVLKLPNFSENLAIAERLFSAQVDSSFLSLYDSHVAKEILLQVLTLFQIINNCVKKHDRLVRRSTYIFHKGSLFFLLYGQKCAQKMRALVHHPDVDVKEKVPSHPCPSFRQVSFKDAQKRKRLPLDGKNLPHLVFFACPLDQPGVPGVSNAPNPLSGEVRWLFAWGTRSPRRSLAGLGLLERGEVGSRGLSLVFGVRVEAHSPQASGRQHPGVTSFEAGIPRHFFVPRELNAATSRRETASPNCGTGEVATGAHCPSATRRPRRP